MLRFSEPWTFRQKSRAGELAFLFLLLVLIPLSVGLQLFPRFSFTLSLILVNLLQLPSIILLYRLYLPRTLLKGRYGWFFLLLPVFLLLYEANSRASSLTVMHLPFIPEGYQANLAAGKPGHFPPVLVQNLDYTLLVLLSSAGFLYFREGLRRQQALAELQADKLRLELEGLKTQLQPHFFFNTLNNLYALSLQGSPRTSVMIANLSGIMRYVLYEARQPQVLLAKEIAFLHSFIDLERIRRNHEESIRLQVQGRPEGKLVEPLLFLPLVENCFKHAQGGAAELLLSVDEEELVFQAANPLPLQPAERGGIGLQNLRKRLELLYPGRHQLDILEDSGTFTVTLTLRWN